MRRLNHIAILVLISLIVTGCATTKGKVSSGRYESPMGNFSIPLPKWPGLKVQDQSDDYGGRVSMHGDFGGLWAITYLRLPANADISLKDQSEKDAAYRGFVTDLQMQNLFQRASPQARIVHEEYLYKGDDRAYFSVVNIPEGAALVDMQKNKRLDSVRGLLVFSKGGFMYMLESEMNSVFSQVNPSSLNSKQIESSKASLKEMRDSMTFN